MHVIVPTEDLLFLVSKMRPNIALKTSGLSYSVYTFEAQGDKLKMYAGDGFSVLITSEIFAQVKVPGKASINGESFHQLVTKFTPLSETHGSKEIELKATFANVNQAKHSRLYLNTETTYDGKVVKQNRWFQLVKEQLVDKYVPTPDVQEVDLPIKNLPLVMKQVVKMVAAYVSDVIGLSGVLISIQERSLKFVVSDGSRILEMQYKDPIESPNFAVLLPKTTCNLLQSMVGQGNTLKLFVAAGRVRFEVNNDGLISTLTSHTINAQFPPYLHIFNVEGTSFMINRSMLYDNVVNMRKALDDEVNRIIFSSDGNSLVIQNIESQAHVGITNAELPLEDVQGGSFLILLNAFLLEGLLGIFENDKIKFTIGEERKPILIEETNSQMYVRAIMAQAIE